MEFRFSSNEVQSGSQAPNPAVGLTFFTHLGSVEVENHRGRASLEKDACMWLSPGVCDTLEEATDSSVCSFPVTG